MSTHNVSLVQALLGGAVVRPAEDAVGYWSPATAPINWCESDYEVSLFVAEFWNTITNLAYVVVGGAALRHRGLSIRLMCAAICCILTGIFSGLFHATLYLEHQRLDEVFENGILIFLCYDDKNGAMALAHFAIATAGILHIESIRFCEIHLVTMIFITIYKFAKAATNVPAVQRAIHISAAATAAGFASWLVDRTCCRLVSTPHGFFPFNLQLHAWWHIWTALALHQGFVASRLLSRLAKQD
ncbi:unnamed protein product [Aphanomyces euteiches]|uniref:Alkaline ceramidase n=1 Tax=Aphanomyces euteiches TaxID=100861 RepID=A0A6G0W450_9STRA|nr:hypothetical protein Ae201684_018895 [Aphanomyces euteiches]KAH9089704.1 hypothetical protein Ae201684P_007870 [Aphanomyces euteiches]KAH9154397.1 hypothetical protein AeRB84_003504 [Aphanomyces euteiches]